MSDTKDLALALAFLAGMKRVVEDTSAENEPIRTGSSPLVRALLQSAGTYMIVEALYEIESPAVRSVVAAGLAYAGHTAATGAAGSEMQRLLGDTLRCAAGSAAILGAVEAAVAAIQSLQVERPFGDYPRVFVSHSWAESEDFFALKQRLLAELTYLDHSVHVGKALVGLSDDELEAKLRLHMRGTHVLLVLAHPSATRSPWVQREVEIAHEFGKPIIAVRPRGHRHRPLHPLLRAASIDQVGWDAPAIAKRIRSWSELVKMADDDS